MENTQSLKYCYNGEKMNLRLIILEQTDYIEYKNDMQEAFRLGAADVFGMEEDVLPEEDIQKSLNMDNCRAYKAVIDEKMVGGAIIEVNEQTHHNHLHFLYVKHGFQSRGIGQAIWQEIEKKYPETEVWETVTPYFEKRNIHFYVNRCGFHIVAFHNKKYQDPYLPDEDDEMFVFRKYFGRENING